MCGQNSVNDAYSLTVQIEAIRAWFVEDAVKDMPTEEKADWLTSFGFKPLRRKSFVAFVILTEPMSIGEQHGDVGDYYIRNVDSRGLYATGNSRFVKPHIFAQTYEVGPFHAPYDGAEYARKSLPSWVLDTSAWDFNDLTVSTLEDNGTPQTFKQGDGLAIGPEGEMYPIPASDLAENFEPFV